MENIIMLILGVFISVVGIVNIKGNISTIHSYNRRKVKEEDIPKYGKTVGTGTLIIGISLVLGFIVSFWSEITKVWKSCWNRNTDYRNISCIRFYCFVLERRNYGIHHSDSDYYRIRFDSLWSIQI